MQKKHLHFLAIFLFLTTYLQAQQFRTLALLPAELEENSGILVSGENSIWLHNDSGDSAKLYQVDTMGVLMRTLHITNATNIDWEDIATDYQGNVYIGDIGNNNNNRQDLRIYKIAHPDSITGDSTTAEIINFVYADQTAFPPNDTLKDYDAEALIWHQDSLYIFTKNRTNPYDGYTHVYQIPADTGTHIATRIDSFDTGEFNFILSITAASISADGEHLALLNGAKIWLFSDIVGNDFFANPPQVYNLNGLTQKEAIGFVDNTTLYLSEEQSTLGDARLYIFDLAPFLDIITAPTAWDAPLRIYPNPTRDILTIELDRNANYVLTNALGRQVMNGQISTGTSSIYMNDLPNGIYYLTVIDDNNEAVRITQKVVKY